MNKYKFGILVIYYFYFSKLYQFKFGILNDEMKFCLIFTLHFLLNWKRIDEVNKYQR